MKIRPLMKAIEEKWGEDTGIVIYHDLSGHVFNDFADKATDIDYDSGFFSFDDITKVTLVDIEQAPLVPEEE